MLILRMVFAEPFPASRAAHGGRDKVAGVAFGRDGLTRAFRSSEVGMLSLHRSASDVAQEYRVLLGWGAGLCQADEREDTPQAAEIDGLIRTIRGI